MRRRKHTLKTSEKSICPSFLCETGGDSETARYGIADMSYRAVFYGISEICAPVKRINSGRTL